MKKVYFWHLKALGYCNRQMRVWCKEKGISWRDLIDNGIDSEYLMEIDGTSMAQNAVDFAEASGWSEFPISADSDSKDAGCV